MPLPVLFTVAFAIAVMINYPNLEQQKERIASHAGNVLAVVSLVFPPVFSLVFYLEQNGRCHG